MRLSDASSPRPAGHSLLVKDTIIETDARCCLYFRFDVVPVADDVRRRQLLYPTSGLQRRCKNSVCNAHDIGNEVTEVTIEGSS